MSTERVIGVILLTAVITFLLRSLPFLIFRGERKMPRRVMELGKVLPATIMAVLIVYCMKDVGNDFTGDGIFKCIAILVVAGSYKWKHNTFLSILLGTLCYMVFVN